MSTQKPPSRRFLAFKSSSAEKQPPQSPSAHRNGFPSQTRMPMLSTHPQQAPKVHGPAPTKRFAATLENSINESGEQENRLDNVRVRFGTQTARPKATPWKSRKMEHIDDGVYIGPSMDRSQERESCLEDMANSEQVDDEPNDEEDEEDEEMLFKVNQSAKRRRISTKPFASTSMQDQSKPIKTPHNPVHHFRLPARTTPAPSSASSIAPPTTSVSTSNPHRRPHFILPVQPTSPPKPVKPLPEIFSPSRKNNRYMPGGLSTTMQSWIIEMASTGIAAQDHYKAMWGRHREDGVKIRVHVTKVNSGAGNRTELGGPARETECFPGSVVFVTGISHTDLYDASRVLNSISLSSGEVRLLLAGQGGSRSSSGLRVREGDTVGVRAPVWDVQILGERWTVGVDWLVM